MEELNINLILLFLVILVILFDLLRNIRSLRSKKLILAGTLSYAAILAFFACYIYYPSGTALLIAIVAIGIIPCGYYWYHRTTKGEKKREALIAGILILAGLIYFFARLF